MDRSTAQSKVREALQNPFDKNRFVDLVKNLLNRIDESKAVSFNNQYVKEMYREYVKSYERMATYTDPNGKKTEILIVYLQKEASLERARTAQRNFVAQYLKNRAEKDAGLVAFVSPDLNDWRFSFVKMEYKFTEGPGGKTKVKEEFTPAKRYSFLVGKYENSHTAQSRIVPVLMELKTNPLLEEIEDIFSVEKITKEFFEKYRELFVELKDELDKIVKNNHKIKMDFDDKGIETADFAKKLLGQIVFLYFLQKKGWFGVNKGMDWGSGSKRFLRDLFDKKIIPYKNFFNDILEPLFYDALARDRSDIDYYNEHFKTKIPFLNGGLFDPLNNYDWVNSEIEIDNILFSNNERTKQGDNGTGILDVFDRYNFTVKEDEPLEKEVAVDPEMLGKVFENLLEVKDRKSKGTYYTPREIVHYMCEQSLINYLATELEGKASKGDIEKLIKHGEALGENEARVENKGEETSTYSYKLSESIRNHAKLIDQKLADIKVCDPAIGSGAFPVGMMSEIVKARNVLSSYIKGQDRTIYNFKRDCIQNSLYGVDIDPSAVDIAKLRLWLSLVVDEEDIKQIKPLPNLDYKIMQGNSLLEEFEGIKLFDEKLISAPTYDKEKEVSDLKQKESSLRKELNALYSQNKLTPTKKKQLEEESKRLTDSLKQINKQDLFPDSRVGLFEKHSEARKKADELKLLHKEYFDASHKDDKDKIRKQIDALEWDLIETTLREQGKGSSLKKIAEFKKSNIRPFFLWKLHFADVFQEKGGFDVVIANPPYLSHDKIREKDSLAENFKAYEPFADLYCYFLEVALSIHNNKGGLCYITSNSYLKAEYGKPLRDIILENDSILSIINIEDFQVFDAAIVNTAILIAQCRNYNREVGPKCLVVNARYDGNMPFEGFIEKNKFYYSQNDFRSKSWHLLQPYMLSIKKKIENMGKSLETYGAKIRLGIATGANEVFVIDGLKKKELIKKDPHNKNLIKPILRGRDIFRYKYQFNDKYIILAANGIDIKSEYPKIYDYLDSFGISFKKRGARGTNWSNLRPTAFLDDFKKEKIIWIELTDKSRFALCSEEIYLLNSAYFLIPPAPLLPKYLLALLNSTLIEFYLGLIAETSGMGVTRWINNYVKEFPIPEISITKQQVFVDFVDRIIAITKEDNYSHNADKQAKVREYEKQIDQMVYKLYGLTEEDVKVVEGMQARENDR